MKSSPKPIHLPRFLKPDHTHTCVQCGCKWTCRDYSKKDCLAKGVAHAVKVNGQGPFCWNCCKRIMAKRRANLDRPTTLPKHLLLLVLLLLAGCASNPPAPASAPTDFSGCPQDASRLSVFGYDWLNGRPNYIDLKCDWYGHVYRIAVDWPTNVPPPTY